MAESETGREIPTASRDSEQRALFYDHCQDLLSPGCCDDICRVHSAAIDSTVSSSTASGARAGKLIPVIVEHCRLLRLSDASPRQRVLIDVVKRSMASTRRDHGDKKIAPTL